MDKKYARHQTVHPSLKKQIERLRGIIGVTRVIVGPSRGIRHNRPVGSLKIQTDAPAGIRILGYSDRGVSQFFVVTSDPCRVRQLLQKEFNVNE